MSCNYNIDPARSLPARIKFLKLGKCYSGTIVTWELSLSRPIYGGEGRGVRGGEGGQGGRSALARPQTLSCMEQWTWSTVVIALVLPEILKTYQTYF